jgi:acyl-CoA reductase-like NAD-dependent aldehyde dehydrogenase
VQRILVEQSVYGKFTDLLVDGVKKLKTGDPMEESTDVGPLIRESDAIRVIHWVEELCIPERACSAAVAATGPWSIPWY